MWPLGSTHSVPIDVRLVVASNAILEDEVCAGRFRADLFHRLNEFKIELLPLRERRADILWLAERCRRETNAEREKQIGAFSDAARAYLLVHDWSGNVRELRNVVRRAVLLSQERIELHHLRQRSSPQPEPQSEAHIVALPEELRTSGRGLYDIIHDAVMELDQALIQHALVATHNNKKQAAKMLHIGYKTLYRKLKEHDML